MHCLFCHQPLTDSMNWSQLFSLTSPTNQPTLCSLCSKKLEKITGDQCQICSRPFSKINKKFQKHKLCMDCYKWEQHPEWKGVLAKNRSLFYYNDFLKDVLSQFKFRGDYELVKIFAPPIRQLYRVTFTKQDPPIVIPVPLSAERQYERGFNQASAIASLLHQPLHHILIRTHSEKQSKKTRMERMTRPSPFHLVTPLKKELYQNKTLLIIDDIYTTGTTIREIAKTLQVLQPTSIYSITIARS